MPENASPNGKRGGTLQGLVSNRATGKKYGHAIARYSST